MVLPSGSFLHSNYLCFLWHPVLHKVREFVRAHPVHPDDVTVSMIVSQLAGRAPRVYSRRLNVDPAAAPALDETNNQRARNLRLNEYALTVSKDTEGDIVPDWERKYHRKLLLGIQWGSTGGMTDAKRYWADLREQAINSVVRYFGSLNSGSIGWCEGTEYYDATRQGKCEPMMAKQGWLPWMGEDGEPFSDCP
jgi:hypothetical protein